MGEALVGFWDCVSKVDYAQLAQIITGIAAVVGVSFTAFQLRENRKDRRMQQASMVSSWFLPSGKRALDRNWQGLPSRCAAIVNGSPVPVYEVVVSVVGFHGAGFPTRGYERTGEECRSKVPCVPPGRWLLAVPTYGSGMFVVESLEIAFIDNCGRHWVRRGTGELEEIPKDAISYYGLSLPVAYDSLVRDE